MTCLWLAGDWRPGPLAPSLGLCACPRGQGRLDGVSAPCWVAWRPRPPWARLHQAAQSASSPKGPAPLGQSWWEGRHCWNVPSQERRVGGPLHQQILLAAQVPPPPGSLTRSPVACASCPHVCGSHGPSQVPALAASTRQTQSWCRRNTGHSSEVMLSPPGLSLHLCEMG